MFYLVNLLITESTRPLSTDRGMGTTINTRFMSGYAACRYGVVPAGATIARPAGAARAWCMTPAHAPACRHEKGNLSIRESRVSDRDLCLFS